MRQTQLINQEQLVANMQQQLSVATALLDKMKAQYAPVEKWEPKGGGFYINYYGKATEADTAVYTRKHGLERSSMEQAQEAAKHLRQSNRLHSWIAENATGEVSHKVEFEEDNVAIVIYAPKDDISRLEQLVNDGTVVL